MMHDRMQNKIDISLEWIGDWSAGITNQKHLGV
jgi:hypothetical protein